MDLNKLLNKLGEFLEESEQEETFDCAEIRELIKKLKKKRVKLEEKIAEEKSSSKRKSLKLDLKITKVEIKKGKKLMKEKCL